MVPDANFRCPFCEFNSAEIYRGEIVCLRCGTVISAFLEAGQPSSLQMKPPPRVGGRMDSLPFYRRLRAARLLFQSPVRTMQCMRDRDAADEIFSILPFSFSQKEEAEVSALARSLRAKRGIHVSIAALIYLIGRRREPLSIKDFPMPMRKKILAWIRRFGHLLPPSLLFKPIPTPEFYLRRAKWAGVDEGVLDLVTSIPRKEGLDARKLAAKKVFFALHEVTGMKKKESILAVARIFHFSPESIRRFL